MDSTTEVLKYFRKLIANKSMQVKNDEFRAAIAVLKEEAFDRGLTEEAMDICADLILRKNLTSAFCQELLMCMVPITVVGNATTTILQWIITYYKTQPIQSIIAALCWITGLVDFGLTDENKVDGFYHIFYFLLRRTKLEPYACKLIYIFTKPEDVTRWRVTQVLKFHHRNGRKKHTSALLCLFKSYKPEFVPESVPAMSINFAFRNIKMEMAEQFKKAQERKQALNIEPENWVKELMWKVAESRIKGSKKMKVDLIPKINYIHFGSILYRQEEKRSILEFNKMETLGCYHLSIDIPCNIMSLLDNIGGLHILTFGTPDMQNRFSYNLYYTFYNVFISKEKNVDDKEKETLLDQVTALEQYMQQGIPLVSHFLGEYLYYWNGLDFCQQIFKLLEWITFSSFIELHDCILIHIRTLFVSSNVNTKCDIISMLGRMMQNMLIVGTTRQERNYYSLFLKVQEVVNFEETVKALSIFIVDLCILGLNLENGNAILIDEIFHFCEMAIFWETKSELPLWTLMPPGIVYRGLFTRNPCHMARVCGLLLKYKKHVYPRLKAMGNKTHFKDKQNRAEEYVMDFLNCLWDEEAFRNRSEGYIFKDLPSNPIKALSNFVFVNKAFDLSEHFALIPLIYHIGASTPALRFNTLNKMDCLRIVRVNFPEIYNFLSACLNDKSSPNSTSMIKT